MFMPQQYETRGLSGQQASSAQWGQGLESIKTPPHHDRRRNFSGYSVHDNGPELRDLTRRMDDLDVRTWEMQKTLATHAQTTREWQQHSDDQFHNLHEQLRAHHDYTTTVALAVDDNDHKHGGL
ncbi:hypothetical protein PR202_ga24360 [Eleusine coracana subsp. coracana]|uniref:Uncharacterized protein n=1 Tax=Eleusine coracana subsp. coracana TaxID=191504 RepID=A0AAV5D916_ELECO|nr:hypothetical protein PR202_ga24360 [Eleusine coracana subsp. coracana]